MIKQNAEGCNLLTTMNHKRMDIHLIILVIKSIISEQLISGSLRKEV